MPRPIIPPEVNQPDKPAPLLVGRDPGSEETGQGRPFVGPAGSLLFGGYDNRLGQHVQGACANAGLMRSDFNITNRVLRQPWNNDFYRHSWDDIKEGRRELEKLIAELQPSVIIATGNEAAYDLVPNWKGLTDRNLGEDSGGSTIKSAKGILDRRGFFWYPEETGLPCPLLVALHPASCLYQAMPHRVLLDLDFRRLGAHLRGELQRRSWPEPIRVTSSGDLQPLWDADLVSYDIETRWGGTDFLCIAFYTSTGHALLAYADGLGACREWLESDRPKLAQNSQFDRYFLEAKMGIPVGGRHEDTIVAHWACFGLGQNVQMADGSLKNIEDLKVGDKIIAFDEEPPDLDYGRRRWQVGEVEAVAISENEILEIVCQDGSTLCVTPNHPVMTEGKQGSCGLRRRWKKAKDLVVTPVDSYYKGSRLSYLYEPIKMDPYDAGYLAAIFDGEGSLSYGREGAAGLHLTICTQKDNAVLKQVIEILDRYSFDYSVYDHKNRSTKAVQLLGGLTGILQFIASVRPVRSYRILKALPRYGMTHQGKKIVEVRSLGQQPIIQVKTSTSTLIVNGFASHNCYPELAGKSDTGREDQKKKNKNEMTRKGLNFLASMHLDVPWWKTYTSDPALMGQLCVNDVAATSWIWEIQEEDIEDMQVRDQYERQLRKLPALIAVQKRGFRVDEGMRQKRIQELSERQAELEARSIHAALSFLREHGYSHRPDGSEYWWYHDARCECCFGGAAKREHCDSCAGIQGSGSGGGILKRDLVLWAWRHTDIPKPELDGMKKDELTELLPACSACGGAGSIPTWDVNVMSPTQMPEILWNLLEVPKYVHRGKGNADAEVLQRALEWAEEQR